MGQKNTFSVELLFFNCLRNLQRSLPTYIDYVDEVIAVDGKHKMGEQGFNLLSTDGSREYLQSFDKVRIIDMPNDYEVDKRKMVKNLCNTLNLIIIDSDSYVEGDWEEFHLDYERKKSYDWKHKNLYKLKLQRDDSPDAFVDFPLVYYNPWEFTYYQNKHAIPIKKTDANKPGIFAPDSFDTTIKGIKIMHDRKLCTDENWIIRNAHNNFLLKFENTSY
jgi:hypothetical protein